MDKNEGRFGGMETVGVFFTRREATKAAEGADVMGTNAKVQVVKAVMSRAGCAYAIGEKVEKTHDDMIREQALSKLSKREKQVLGVEG